MTIRKTTILVACLVIIGSHVIQAADFTDNGNSTVTDADTKLTWQQTEGGTKTWESALTYCEGLTLGGSTDWRLPNLKELQTIVKYDQENPNINTTFFPSAVSLDYWSSTIYAANTIAASCITFTNGRITYSLKTNSFNVRCVRGGQ